MKARNHAIQSLKFDLSFYSEQQAPALFNRISNLANARLYSVINQVCDEEFGNNMTFVRVDKLELDLGQVTYTGLENLLPGRLYNLFKMALHKQLFLVNSRPAEVINGDSFYSYGYTSDERSWGYPELSDTYPGFALQSSEDQHCDELLLEYLQKGTLPWWAAGAIDQQIESIFNERIKREPDEIIRRIFSSPGIANIIQRMVFQFAETTLAAFAETAAGSSAFARQVLQYAAAIKEALSSSPYHIRFESKRWWKMLLDILCANYLKHRHDPRSAVQFIIEHIALENALHESEIIAAINEHFDLQNLPDDAGRTFFQILRRLQVPEKPPGSVDNLPAAEPLLRLIEKTRQGTGQQVLAFGRELLWLKMKNPQLYKKAYAYAEAHIGSPGKPFDFTAYTHRVFNFISAELPDDPVTVARLRSILPHNERDEPDNRYPGITGSGDEAAADVYYIANAGLVLFNPFFPAFFDRLGLMRQGRFTSKFEAGKAIHLLQFLVDNEHAHGEHLLLLNKLLCGIDIYEPVEKEIRLSEGDEKIAMELLNAVKDNWPALKNSSIEALRIEFLQRTGQLKRYSNKWVMRVEHNGRSDYLLEKLPWSFCTIKNSWMPEILNVEWI